MMHTATHNPRTRFALTSFLLGSFLISSVSPSLYAMEQVDWDSKTISDRGFSDIASKRSFQKGKLTTKMPTYNETFVDDGNDFDSASTVEYGREARLIDDQDLRKYIKRLCLQISPTNYDELHGHAVSFIKKGLFNRFDKGIFIQWRASALCDDRLPALLMALSSITKLKVSVEWDTEDRHFAEIMADSLQGFEHLEEMDLSGCSFTDEELMAIIESTGSRALTKLNLLGNSITVDVLQEVQDRFTRLKQLKTDIRENEDALSPLSTPGSTSGMKSSTPSWSSPSPIAHDVLKAEQEERVRVERERQFALERDALAFLQQAEVAARQEEEKRQQQLARERETLAEQERDIEKQRHAEEALKLKNEQERIAKEKEALITQQRNLETAQKRLSASNQIPEGDKKPSASLLKSDVSIALPPPPQAKAVTPPAAEGGKKPSAIATPPSIPQTMTRSYPSIARGYEAIYDRFMNGRLVYKGPAGERTFAIADVVNASLEGEFDLRGLTYTSGKTTSAINKDLRIKVGYRQVQENDGKVTVWLVPKFIIDDSNSSFKSVSWSSDVGIFWTYGNSGLNSFDYLTSYHFDEISSENLYDLYIAARPPRWVDVRDVRVIDGRRWMRRDMRRTRAVFFIFN